MNGCIPTLYNLWSMLSVLGSGPKRASEFAGGVFCNFWCVASVTRPRGSRGRVIWEFSLSRVRFGNAYVSFTFCSRHASASVTRSRRYHFALGTRPRHPCVLVAAFSSKLHFLLSFHFCMFPFCPLSHSCPMRPENT